MEQQEYAHHNTTERSANASVTPGVERPAASLLSNWIKILCLVIDLVGLVGNGLVLWLLGFRIKRNPFSVYILNLAGADALVLCSSFLNSTLNFFSNLRGSLLHRTVAYATIVFYAVGLSLLAAISTERCLSVLFPIWYRCHRPKHTSATICAMVWALASLFWTAGFVFCFEHVYPFCRHYFLIELLYFLLLTCVLCLSSLTLLLRVQCTSRRWQPPRLYLVVLLTVLVFLFCGLGPVIDTFLTYLTGLNVIPLWLSWFLAYVNSSANPFIYFFLGRQKQKRGREPLRVVLQRALGDEGELGDGERETTLTMTPETSF